MVSGLSLWLTATWGSSEDMLKKSTNSLQVLFDTNNVVLLRLYGSQLKSGMTKLMESSTHSGQR